MTTPLLYAQLSNAVFLEVTGKDAERYLNNRVSSNLKVLRPHRAIVYTAALSTQGKTEGFFVVYKTSEQGFMLMADGGDSKQILAALSRFKVADKVTFKDKTKAYSLVHIWPQAQALNIKGFEFDNDQECTLQSDGSFVYERNRFGSPGFDWIQSESAQILEQGLRETELTQLIPEEQQSLLRLRAAIPEFPVEIGPQYLLQEAALKESYSIKKGCYVGQEVIQKIESFAATPAKLWAFRGPGRMEMGAVCFGDRECTVKIGSLISCAYDSSLEKTFGFARAKLNADSKDLIGFIGDKAVEFFPPFDFTDPRS